MKIILDRKACAAIDKGVAGKFEHLSMALKESGMYVQAVDKSKSIVVDHYIDKVLLESYTEGEGVTVPHVKFLLNGMDRLYISRVGALLKLLWTGEGVTLEKNLYTLDFEWTEVEYSLGSVVFPLPYTGLALIRKVCGGELEMHVRESAVEIRALSENCVTLTAALDTPVGEACMFTLLKYHLDRLPKYAYTTATFSVYRQGLVALSLEALGVITTVTIATEVVFFS
ncbi:uncharacterized protein NEMAJ01_1307 [Nematocida major]|uniref:uncharacterized protein n=1 Tax=Nematocida major TaxID=1912982 RepID=UPI00200842EC|nr:uncharacterized protein NEMAJ01_1307 [Nematocida major]KAH9386411.1 hypothetical protein NEMAJ01_1307 [Nematocida major]